MRNWVDGCEECEEMKNYCNECWFDLTHAERNEILKKQEVEK